MYENCYLTTEGSSQQERVPLKTGGVFVFSYFAADAIVPSVLIHLWGIE